MTPEQVTLVKTSWSMIVPIADQAGQMFYNRLFELNPALKPLFKTDQSEQIRKLMSSLNMAVTSLDRLEEIVPVAQTLGRRHADYGVKDEDYDTVGAALLWTLERGLGDGFTDEVKNAWTTAYGILASTMKEAAAEAV
jgi:hemoglobin-like flavoprotein